MKHAETRREYFARTTFGCAVVGLTIVPLFAWLGLIPAAYTGACLLTLYIFDLVRLIPWFWRRRDQ